MDLPVTDHLLHAYGFATDSSGHLTALSGDDSAAAEAAVGYLASAIMHQGTPWPATGPVAEYVAHLVSTQATSELVHEALQDFLSEVLDAIEMAHEDGGEEAIRAEIAATGRDLDAELRITKDLELEFADEVFAEMVMAHAYLGVLAVEPAVRAALAE